MIIVCGYNRLLLKKNIFITQFSGEDLKSSLEIKYIKEIRKLMLLLRPYFHMCIKLHGTTVYYFYLFT